MQHRSTEFATVSAMERAFSDWCAQFDWADDQGNSLLFQIFATCTAEQAKRISSEILNRFPDATVIGMSAHNGITAQGVFCGQVLISVSQFDHTQISAAMVTTGDQPEHAINALAAQLAAPDNKVVICFAHGFEAFDQIAFASLNSPIPWVGGIADFSGEAQGPWVMLNHNVAAQHCVAVALRSDRLAVQHRALNEWLPIGRRLTVTSAEGQRLQKLDEQTAMEAYSRYFSDGRLCSFEICQDFPLVWQNSEGDTFYSAPSKLFDDGSMQMTMAVPVGTEVQFCYFHPKLARQRLATHLNESTLTPPEAIYLYYCASRIYSGDGLIEEEITPFRDLASTSGVFCFGEFAGEPCQRIVSHSITYLMLSETPERALSNEVRQRVGRHELDTNFHPVFNLINQAFYDLDSLNQSLASEVKQQAEILLAHYRIHPVTGLPLRHALLDEHSHQLAQASAVAVVKLANLGGINDRYGDAIGDHTVKQLSQQMLEACQRQWPDAVLVGQLSSTEWLLVFTGDAQVRVPLLEVWLAALEQAPYRIDSVAEPIPLTLNCGLFQPDRVVDFSQGVELDRAIHRAKEARRQASRENRLVWQFARIDNKHWTSSAKLAWHSRVKQALADNRIEVWGQPIYTAGQRSLCAIECLVRIREADDVINPGLFLPAIEGTSTYHQLSQSVIRQAVQTLDPLDVTYSINLAPQDLFNPDTHKLLLTLLERAQHPHHLSIEIVETEHIKDYQRLQQKLAPLQALGARLVVDDFGSGYSNMEEVLKLEPSVVKLDGSLVRDIDSNARQRRMVEHLNNLCQSLNIATVAEFVRNAKICLLVEQLGINYLQGFYLAEPRPLTALVAELLQA